MTPEAALLDAVAALQARDVLAIACEEAAVQRNLAAQELAKAIRRKVRARNSERSRRAVERAADIHKDALVALLELRMTVAVNVETAQGLATKYDFEMEQVEQEVVNRRIEARMATRRVLVEA